MTSITLNIVGMTRGHCAAAVARALQKVDGVQRVQASREPDTARVEAAPNADPEQLAMAVQEEGCETVVA